MRKRIVSVIGGHDCNKEVEQIAHDLGKKLAKVVDILVSGGLSGTMKAVCRGFKSGKGITIGIIPSYNKKDANEFVDVAIPTGIGLARNVLVVKSADLVIALPGEAGTLSEIAYCLQFGIPVIALVPKEIPGKGHMTTKFLAGLDVSRVIKVKTIEQAVARVKTILNRSN